MNCEINPVQQADGWSRPFVRLRYWGVRGLNTIRTEEDFKEVYACAAAKVFAKAEVIWAWSTELWAFIVIGYERSSD